MSIQNIEKSLRQRFNAPLQELYNRRIIFWHDPDREFVDAVDELNIEGVKLLKLTGTNNFYAKMLLSETDTESNYLVYNPISYKDLRDNWLLDIECYSEEFRADLLSIRMSELGMASTHQLRTAIKRYSKFFENKERVARLTQLGSTYNTAGQLHIDVLSVLCETDNNSVHGVIKALLIAGRNENNWALENIRKFGSEEILWSLIGKYTGFEKQEGSTLAHLAAHVLMTALAQNASESMKKGLEKLISDTHVAHCYALINEWMHSDDDDALYDIARDVEETFMLANRFDRCEISELVECECFPCINECILRSLMNEICEHVVKVDSIVETVEKRRAMKWYKRVQHYYDGIYQVACMQKFYRDHAAGFHIAEHQKLWEAYCNDYYKMDTYYRLFHVAYGRSLRESATILEDQFKGVVDYVEGLYKTWYLAELGEQWTTLICDEMYERVALTDIAQQSDFYKSRVAPMAASGSRVYVIISDALRYEVAAQLAEVLIRDTKGSAKISAMQAIFPSATKYGMAALLPNNSLQLTSDFRVLCDGASTEGTAARGEILRRSHSGNIAVTYKEIRDMKKAERRELVAGAEVVYIYHNTIDALGDKVITEEQVFEGCDEAISEIKNLIRVLVNDLSASNILITADHGFIYSYKPLEESDRAEKGLSTGNVLELDRRYMISDSEADSVYFLKVPMTHLNTDYCGFAPRDTIRIKKQGGGANYVHGGLALQECVVPVIEFKNIRAGSKEFVQAKKATLQLLSQSRKVSNSIFSLDLYQPEPVGGKILPATYEVHMCDALGQLVSDRQKVIADKTNDLDADRVIRVRFNLKSMQFKKTETYFLMIVDKNTGGVLDKIAFSIDIAFINDFDF